MSNEQLRQHQKLARGESIMSGESCESPFKNGVSHDGDGSSKKRALRDGGRSHDGDGSSKKRALKDGKRSHDGTTRHPDHGPHDMGVPNPRTD